MKKEDLVRDLRANLLLAVEDDQHSPPHPLYMQSDGEVPTHVARPPRWTAKIVHTQFGWVKEPSGNDGDACGIDGEEHSEADPTGEVRY